MKKGGSKINVHPFYVITGGPGSGKTALINELNKRGYEVVEEFSRNLIKEQARGGEKLPWANNLAFDKIVIKKRIGQYKKAPVKSNCFFDRGIPDCIAYVKFSGKEVPLEFYSAADKYRYQKTVFFLPSWKKIFVNDPERRETFSSAQKISKCIKKTYSELGYNIFELPKSNVKKRVDVILSHLTIELNEN